MHRSSLARPGCDPLRPGPAAAARGQAPVRRQRQPNPDAGGVASRGRDGGGARGALCKCAARFTLPGPRACPACGRHRAGREGPFRRERRQSQLVSSRCADVPAGGAQQLGYWPVQSSRPWCLTVLQSVACVGTALPMTLALRWARTGCLRHACVPRPMRGPMLWPAWTAAYSARSRPSVPACSEAAPAAQVSAGALRAALGCVSLTRHLVPLRVLVDLEGSP